MGYITIFTERISIHALREEGDKQQRSDGLQQRNFYPRPPRGGRPDNAINYFRGTDFYPRPPRGGRPKRLCGRRGAPYISIHALREEGDRP